MANTVISLFSVVLLCMIAVKGKTKLQYSKSEWLRESDQGGNGETGGIKEDGDFREVSGRTSVATGVTTEDSHILSLQRLPAGRSGNKADKPPVLLQHGLLCDAIIWVTNSPEQSLGFILADNGYTVWLANVCGTKYSRRHTSLNPTHLAYWDWSWDELANYDLPAFAKYVYSHIGQQMHYAGHSLLYYQFLFLFSGFVKSA
ncbi:hypothetical protein VNO78_22390 [Psophocarpus tetragonolobus]|uniref:Partial AB-hydrolase lipase domain-containing protein n=1 Tax=Psophocarpus tetragonolobus TaxID=3891 RepID=A0AAN9SDQ7_PSOTE